MNTIAWNNIHGVSDVQEASEFRCPSCGKWYKTRKEAIYCCTKGD